MSSEWQRRRVEIDRQVDPPPAPTSSSDVDEGDPPPAPAPRELRNEQAELRALDPLPDDKFERLEALRFMAAAKNVKLTHCPECGKDLEEIDPAKHAESHWPRNVPAGRMSDEALEREAALYKQAGQKPPRRPQ